MGASGITGNHENSTSLNPPFEDYAVLYFRWNCSVICCGLEIMKVQLKFEEYPIRVVGLRRVNCSQLLDCLPLYASALESKSQLPRGVSLLRVRVKQNTNIVCVLRRCVSSCMQLSHRSGRSQFKVKGQSSYRNPRTMLCPCFSDHGYLWYWTMRWSERQELLLLSNKRTKGWPNDPTGKKINSAGYPISSFISSLSFSIFFPSWYQYSHQLLSIGPEIYCKLHSKKWLLVLKLSDLDIILGEVQK